MGLGMVFMVTSMGDDVCTPGDGQKLKKLEQKLVEPKLMITPKLDVLCPSTYRPHLEERFHMVILPTPGKRLEAAEISWLVKY